MPTEVGVDEEKSGLLSIVRSEIIAWILDSTLFFLPLVRLPSGSYLTVEALFNNFEDDTKTNKERTLMAHCHYNVAGKSKHVLANRLLVTSDLCVSPTVTRSTQFTPNAIMARLLSIVFLIVCGSPNTTFYFAVASFGLYQS
ncbi:hypothetical protein CEXT_556981 [Caerostris extrusa]|uniref:G-protein coupled receptors family 1 profile domain-containing protein n=1 Tax=Caerostris extrusa TaxID=172846 RepID=A0AAV4NRL4_CAEEX|nr:hypothetical protein CEXT_556981 [Caerostris extrusa]